MVLIDYIRLVLSWDINKNSANEIDHIRPENYTVFARYLNLEIWLETFQSQFVQTPAGRKGSGDISTKQAAVYGKLFVNKDESSKFWTPVKALSVASWCLFLQSNKIHYRIPDLTKSM